MKSTIIIILDTRNPWIFKNFDFKNIVLNKMSIKKGCIINFFMCK